MGYILNFDIAPSPRSETVFFDPKQSRRAKVWRYFAAIVFFVCAWGIIFFTDMFEQRPLESGHLSQEQLFFYAVDAVASGEFDGEGQQADSYVTELIDHTPIGPVPLIDTTGSPNLTQDCTPRPSSLMAANAAGNAEQSVRVFAHLPSNKERSQFSLARECGAIDVLLPDWFAITNSDLTIDIQPIDAEAKQATGDFVQSRGNTLQLYPLVSIHPGVDQSEVLRGLSDTAKREDLIESLSAAALATHAEGMCLDFGRVSSAHASVVGSFLTEAKIRLAQDGMKTCLVLQAAGDDWKAPAFKAATDIVVVKAYVEPWVGSPVAPVAPEDWFREIASELAQHFGSDRLILALGTSSYDWVSGTAVPEKVSFGEAMLRIGRANSQVTLPSHAMNPQSIFYDQFDRRHHIWMLDAVTAHNQINALAGTGISNIAIWDLGNEDPGVWSVLNSTAGMPIGQRSGFTNIVIEDYLSYQGEGPFIRIAAPATTGQREVEQDPSTGQINALRYTQMPSPARMERFRAGPPDKLVLTFDDGPSDAFTGRILDELKDLDVPAAFFIVGSQIWKNRDLLDRMVLEGHEIGSHSFWHPNMRRVSDARNLFELNMFQHAFSSATGRATVLFREPYQRTGGPISLSHATPMWRAQSLGYFYVSSDVAPPDWEDIDRYQITDAVVKDLELNGGNVIALHDAGSNREETVAAVPLIIAELRARGYQFVGLSDLLGLATAELMPEVAASSGSLFFGMSFRAFNFAGSLWKTIFLTAIAIGIGRSLLMLVLAFRRKPHQVSTYGRFAPPVTVIIPAYNEEETIIEAVDSVLSLIYPNLEVVVVDDGSSDNTFDLLLSKYVSNPRVRIIAQFNQGKWCALNVAMASVKTEYVICIDADTRIDERSVLKLVAHFRDPFVGAVAGKVTISNRKGLLARLQVLEYMVAQSIDRRAAESLNAMLVVPGAIGAWRVSAVEACAGYSGSTLTEDADLTVTMNRLGYTICYEEDAIAVTKAPTSVRQLLAQRARWSLGMLQLAWKHRGAMREGRPLGWFALTDLILYGYVLAFLAPIADFLFISFLIDIGQSIWLDQPTYSTVSKNMLLTYAALPIFDLIVAIAALSFDPSERGRILLLSPIQRFVLRPLLYFSAIRAVLRAVTGQLVKWSKTHRAQPASGATERHNIVS